MVGVAEDPLRLHEVRHVDDSQLEGRRLIDYQRCAWAERHLSTATRLLTCKNRSEGGWRLIEVVAH